MPNATVAEAMAATGAGYVKQYGPGNIATVSLGGLGAAHLAVTWHGVPINSPMLGLCDLSLLPLSLFAEAQLQRGGGQVKVGNGAVSGTLQLDGNEGPTGKKASFVRLGTGSFGLWNAEAAGGWRNERIAVSARAWGSRAANDFPFANTARPGAPRVRQLHSTVQNGGYIADVSAVLGRFTVDAAFWQQSAHREVPPNMTQDTASARQRDDALRGVLGARLDLKRVQAQLSVKTAFLRERLRYTDPGIGLRTDDLAQTIFGEMRFFLRKRSGTLELRAQLWQESALTDSYSGAAQRQRYALLGEYRAELGKGLALVSGLRIERSNFGWAPPLPSLRAEWLLARLGLALEFQAAYNYRIPTFNDLFWRDAGARGNPALRPEQGWSAHIGAVFSPPKPGPWAFRWQTRGYACQMQDLIVWTPDGDGVWQPINAESVRTLGLECAQTLGRAFGPWKVEQSTALNLTHAARLNSRNPLAEGRQMPFVPAWQGTFSLRLGFRGCSLGYRHTFTGQRFLTSTNTRALPAYHLGHLDAQFFLVKKNKTLSVYGSLQNLWDAPYQLVEWRAMPGRSWEAGFRVGF